MILIVVNPQSNAERALRKWDSIKSQIQHDRSMNLDEFMKNPLTVESGDSVIAAGGDGCLHAVVNSVLDRKGPEFLSEIAFGYIGLGSNNSFIQPLKGKKLINSVPVQVGPHIETRDLIEVSFQNQKKVIVSNASFGLLAHANETFNKNDFIQFLKKFSITIADIMSFLITLFRFKPIQVLIHAEGTHRSDIRITNLHFLKSPYFTKDLHFKTSAPLSSGSFDFFQLSAKPKKNLLLRFFSMMVTGNMKKGFDQHAVFKNLTLQTSLTLPLEIDGEIYHSQSFQFKALPGALKVLA